MKQILLGLVLFVSSTTFSQLDSVDFSMSFVTNPVFTVDLDEYALQGEIFQVSVSLNGSDLDSLGILTVMIYDLENSSLMANKLVDNQQLASGMYTYNGQLVLNFPYLIPSGSYRVILEIQNTRGAYLPRIEKIFPTN